MWELRKFRGKGCNSLGLFWGKESWGACAAEANELVLADFVELDSVECKFTSLDTTPPHLNTRKINTAIWYLPLDELDGVLNFTLYKLGQKAW